MFYEFLNEKNTPYFVFVFGLIIIVLIIALFVKQYFFEHRITTKTIKIVTRIETDAVTGDECVKMTIANMGFHSIEIKGFGLKHKNKDYDYLRTYKDERNIPVYQKIVVSPRDSLETIIDLNDLKAKLNTKNVGKFKAYVIDVYGNYTLVNAKDVKKYIELYFERLEYIEKVRKMPKEKQEKCLAKEKMYEERRKKILNRTIDDTFEKADIDGEVKEADATNYAEEVKIVEQEQPKNDVNEDKIYEPQAEGKETKEDEGFVFNFDDSFANSIGSSFEEDNEVEEVEEEK